ncbi:MAG: LytR C-terminal domain-containing protein [Pseudomonadota bacterium]
MNRRNINKGLATAGGVLVGALLVGCAGEPVMQTEVRPVYRVQGDAAVMSSGYEAGLAHYSAGRYGLALESFQQALARHPNSIKALNAVAASYDRLGRFDVAMQYYHRALDIDPRSAQTLNNIGYSLLLQGEREKAGRYFDQALQVEPGNVHAEANCGLLKSAPSPAEHLPMASPQPMMQQPMMQQPMMQQPMMQQPSRPAAPMSSEPRTVAPERAEEPSGLTLEISNGNGRSGMAAMVRDVMRGKYGEQVPHITNADSFAYPRTQILYRPQAAALARRLAERLGVDAELREVAVDAGRTDVKVILGRDVLPREGALREMVTEAKRN